MYRFAKIFLIIYLFVLPVVHDLHLDQTLLPHQRDPKNNSADLLDHFNTKSTTFIYVTYIKTQQKLYLLPKRYNKVRPLLETPQ